MNNITDEEDIIKGNKLIADFVGLKINWVQCNHYLDPVEYDMEIERSDYFFDYDIDLMYLYDEEIPEEFFKFHLSWNWLMLVVEKIENLKHPRWLSYNFSVEIVRNTCTINIGENTNGLDGYVHKSSNSKINAVWLAVVKFIEWYNNYDINNLK